MSGRMPGPEILHPTSEESYFKDFPHIPGNFKSFYLLCYLELSVGKKTGGKWEVFLGLSDFWSSNTTGNISFSLWKVAENPVWSDIENSK